MPLPPLLREDGGRRFCPVLRRSVGRLVWRRAEETPKDLCGRRGRSGPLGRQVDERETLAVRSQVPPRRPEHPELAQLILARHVQRERRRQRAANVEAPDRVAKGRADLPLAHPSGTMMRRFGNPRRSCSSVHPPRAGDSPRASGRARRTPRCPGSYSRWNWHAPPGSGSVRTRPA